MTVLCDVLAQVAYATGEALVKTQMLFTETSAKDGSNVHDLFRTRVSPISTV